MIESIELDPAQRSRAARCVPRVSATDGESREPKTGHGNLRACHPHAEDDERDERHPAVASVRRHGRGAACRARDRARRGRVGVGHRRPPLPRRDREPVVRERRSRAPEIADAIAAQLAKLEAYSAFGDFANPPALELAEIARRACADAGARVFLGSGGGDAIDTAAKLARRYWSELGQPDRSGPAQPQRRLSRHPRLRHRDRRHPGEPRGLRRPLPSPSRSRTMIARRRARRRSSGSAPERSPRSSSSR